MATFDITVNPEGGLSARGFGGLPREAMDLIEIWSCMKEFITTLQAEQFAASVTRRLTGYDKPHQYRNRTPLR